MKRNFSIMTLILVSLLMLSAGPASAARLKGVVTSAATSHHEVCASIAQLSGTEAGTCAVSEEVKNAVLIKATRKLSMKEGQDVILKAKGTGKVMARVAKVLPKGTDLKTLSEAVTNNGAIIVTGEKGKMAVIIPEKPFVPEKDAKVTMKTKQKQLIEGC